MTPRLRAIAAVVVVVSATIAAVVYLALSRPATETAGARVAADLGVTADLGVDDARSAAAPTVAPTVAPPLSPGGEGGAGSGTSATVVVPVATVPAAEWAAPGELVVVRPGGTQPSTVFAAPVGGEVARRLAISCEVVHVAAGRLACFTVGRVRVLDLASQAVLLDHPVVGIPSRVRLSPDGTKVGVTAFETGHSYQALGEFSTRATIVDVASGEASDVTLFRIVGTTGPGQTTLPTRYRDLVAWGVTFRDADEFYVTILDSQAPPDARIPTLARGSLRDRTLTPLTTWAECPSLAPDGTTVAFKERVGDRYRIVRFDLATGDREQLAPSASPDDQVLWADADTLLYTVVEGDALRGRRSTVMRLDVAPGAEPQVVMADASSPALS